MTAYRSGLWTSPSDEADGSAKAGWNAIDSRRVEEALAAMQREIDALKERNAHLLRRLDAHEDDLRRNKAEMHGDASLDEGESPVSKNKRDDGRALAAATDSVAAFNQLKKTVQASSGRLACVSAKSGRGDLVLEGCNVHVRNGGGGDRILQRQGQPDRGVVRDDALNRNGSHYVVVGDSHQWTGHSGILVGYDHASTAYYASVVGGTWEGYKS
jgi:hypothetical protein